MLQVTEEERLKSNDAKAVGINSKCDQSSMSMSDRIKPVLHPKKIWLTVDRVSADDGTGSQSPRQWAPVVGEMLHSRGGNT